MPLPAIDIDRTSPTSLYLQVSTALVHAIETGLLAPGERLPDEVSFAASLGVSRPTMRRAIEELVADGLLTRKRGAGTRVNDLQVRRRVALTSLHDDLTAAGRHPTTRVLAFDPLAVDRHASRMLGLPDGERLIHCERLRYADGAPLAILRNWLPPRFAPLTAADLATQGLYHLLGTQDGRPSVAKQRITARAATATQARLLDISPGAPLIAMQRTAFDASGSPVEFADNLYRADHYTIDVTVYHR
ncbi:MULTISPECIES: GntR family transcriptional regulator [Catenuloplanes]|uniref:DNA-binding GntR family transcriptional regulator n=1 Tax=Catenuloplanes niger TaxID=587534 RepID=A0AAE4CVW1_9ACTN|nr:GntR family transcriptional regulator [Catenuloplanes niger]MDR7325857.1 DNA-binding GntR family transcriptional regulator [Catenuloplanes niger]